MHWNYITKSYEVQHNHKLYVNAPCTSCHEVLHQFATGKLRQTQCSQKNIVKISIHVENFDRKAQHGANVQGIPNRKVEKLSYCSVRPGSMTSRRSSRNRR